MRACPAYFVADGTPDTEVPAPVAEAEPQEPPPDADVALPAEPRVYDEPKVVSLQRAIKVAVGLERRGHPDRIVSYSRGTRFAASEPIVAAIPGAFKNGRRQS